MQERRHPTDDSKNAPRRRGRSTERRHSILEAAHRAIQRHGSGVSMEEIAAEARISRPILYRHFGDRRGMAEAIARDAVAKAIGSRAISEDEGVVPDWSESVDLHATLRDVLTRTLDFIEHQPELYRFILEERAFRNIHPQGDAPSGPLGIVIAPLRAALARMGFEIVDAEFRANAMAGMLASTISWNLETARYDREELEARLFELCLQIGQER